MILEDSERIKRLHRLANTSSDMFGAATLIRESADEIAALRAELDALKADIEAGNLVRLPGELIAPYELNARYWICGWDSDACTLTIQDRALMDEAARAALEGGPQ